MRFRRSAQRVIPCVASGSMVDAGGTLARAPSYDDPPAEGGKNGRIMFPPKWTLCVEG